MSNMPNDLRMKMKLISETMVRANEATAGGGGGGTLFLSNIDHLLMFYNHTVYVYPNRTELSGGPGRRNEEVEKILRNALSEMLVRFGFMGGRLRMNNEEERLEVECNNAGILFSHVETEMTIQEMGSLDFLNPVFPLLTADLEITDQQQLSDYPLMILRVTKFSCGGFVVGVSILHALLDGYSADFFLNQFASAARGEGLSGHPYLHKHSLRARNPPRTPFYHPEFLRISDLQLEPSSGQSDNPSCGFEAKHWKTFSFTTTEIDYLRKKSLEEDQNLRKCSQFEALTAFVWQARTKALGMDPQQISKLMFAVDFRERFNPRLPKELIGNCVSSACAEMDAKKLTESPLSFCVKQIQDAATRISEGYVRSAIDWLQINKGVIATSGAIIISSWVRFSFLRMNLGWGEPAYSGPVFHGDQVKQYALILPMKQQGSAAGGMDVCLALDAQEIHIFTRIYENLCEVAKLDRKLDDRAKTSKL